MEYEKTIPEEQEVTIQIDKVTGMANICSCWPAFSKKLIRRYGEPIKTSKNAGKVSASFWAIPYRAISFRSLAKVAGDQDSIQVAETGG